MYYMERGNGPAVVLLHSYLANAFMWSPQVRAMETNHRVIVPELWGHGSSGHLPQVTSDLSGLANQVGELMEKLELHEYALIGQSVGGMLAGELAAAYPHRITRLVLMATYLGEESAVSRTRFMDLLDRIDARGCIDPPLLEELMPIFFGPYGSAETVALKVSFRRQVSALMPDQLKRSIVPIGRMIFERRSLLAGLKYIAGDSMMVLCGEHDKIRPPAESIHMARLAGCRYVEVPDAGHIPNLESSAFVTRALVDFIDGH